MIWIFVILITLFSKPIYAQNNDIKILVDKYQTDYLYNRDLYQRAYFDFNNKKQIDQKYQTITTQNNKIDSIKNALTARNDMLRTYLMLLRTKLEEYKFSNPEITKNYQTFFQQEENWLSEQKPIINNFQSESEIKNWTTEFQKRYPPIQENVNLALLQYKINAYSQANSDIKSFIIDIQNSKNFTDESKQWIDGISPKISAANISLENAFSFTQKNRYNQRPDNYFQGGQKELTNTNFLLNQIKNDLVWIFIKYLKS